MRKPPAPAAPSIDVFADPSAACAVLAARDKALARALEAIGAPHIRRRPGGFEALFRIIVEQQVSVPSAQAIWARCLAQVSPLTPEAVLETGAEGLRACGLSGPKIRYVLGLAERMASGAFDLHQVEALDDDDALAALQSIKGVGPWSAAIYLLFCDGRADIWPPKDVALLGAYGAARTRGPRPTMARLDGNAVKWKPYRGVAAHILWTYYAHLRGRAPI